MKKLYIFCHGFGFNNIYWNNLARYFKNQECIYLNLGYFGVENTQIISKPGKYEYIGIGHSLGLINLLQLKLPFKYLIGLNGFISFIGNDPLLVRKRTIELKVLKQSFIVNQERSLKSFYNRCEVDKTLIPKQTLNKDKLLLALDNLKTNIKIDNNIKVCIIGSKNDIIVPPCLIADNFNSYDNVKQILLNEGGHSLGGSMTLEIKLLIEEFLNDKL